MKQLAAIARGGVVGVLILAVAALAAGGAPDQTGEVLFCVGTPDNHAAEFGLTGPAEGYLAFPRKYPADVVYTVGKSRPGEWPYIHPAPLDQWAGGRTHTFTIRFGCDSDEDRTWFLVIGMAGGAPAQRSKVAVAVNGTELPAQLAPTGDPRVCFDPTGPGKPDSMVFEIPPGRVGKGENSISIRLDEQSWIIYDYVALSRRRAPLQLVVPPEPDLLAELRQGPMAGVQEIVFAARALGDDPHYHLYEMNLDGSGLRQLTDGPYDDVEPVYLPDGRILFISSRCNRCVNCHTTDVGVLYCCEADGGNIRTLSANNEHDNTPWVLPNGQVLYTRWEYVDRNQVSFHHLWITSPDGARRTVFYGNMHPGTTMIDAKLSEHEQTMIRLWIETGAAYPGTYAALGTGMIGGFEIVDRSIRLDRSDTEWPSTQASMEALKRRCGGCHQEDGRAPLATSPSHIAGPGRWGTAFTGQGPWIDLAPDDVRRRWTRHLLYNLSRPEKSLILLGPLSKKAGGYESCGKAVFADTTDTDYRKVLLAVEDAKQKLDEIKRFDMPGFRPRPEYVREMKRYGMLPTDLPADAPIDVYATDRAYWESHWHRAARRRATIDARWPAR